MKHPEWWDWEIEITPHIEKRMLQRDFNELDLRTMLFSAKDIEKDIEDGRYKIKSTCKGSDWEIIVEPDVTEKTVIVITAYTIENQL